MDLSPQEELAATLARAAYHLRRAQAYIAVTRGSLIEGLAASPLASTGMVSDALWAAPLEQDIAEGCEYHSQDLEVAALKLIGFHWNVGVSGSYSVTTSWGSYAVLFAIPTQSWLADFWAKEGVDAPDVRRVDSGQLNHAMAACQEHAIALLLGNRRENGPGPSDEE